MARRGIPALCAVWIWIISALSVPGVARAQAWLPTRGTFDAGVTYTNVLNKKHYLPNGAEDDAGHTRVQSLALTFAWAITDRVTLTGGLPYVRTQYEGGRPHPTEVDDGDAHASITDWRLGLHYQLSEGPIAFAPFVQIGSPAAAYETLGHASPGRGLDELWLGFYAGRNLDRWLPRSYVQLRYSYAFVEKVAGISHDRSNVDLEFGHFLTPRVTLRALLFHQDTYGGVNVPMPRTNPLFPYHDQLAAEGFLNLGLGVSWAASAKAEMYLLYIESLQGRNGHKVDQSISLGWKHRFSR